MQYRESQQLVDENNLDRLESLTGTMAAGSTQVDEARHSHADVDARRSAPEDMRLAVRRVERVGRAIEVDW